MTDAPDSSDGSGRDVPDDAAEGLARESANLVAFSTLGALSTVQDLAQRIRAGVEGADAELVAEETLCLVAVASARAADVGLRSAGTLREVVVSALLDLPHAYSDYLLGSAMIEQDDPEVGEVAEEVARRLDRKREFYVTHLPEGQFPGSRVLEDKMELWMGRVSPPKLPTSPGERLEELALTDVLVTHCRVVLSYGRRFGDSGEG